MYSELIQYITNFSYVTEQGVCYKDVHIILHEHNRYRQMIMDGKVPNQPQGKYLKYLVITKGRIYDWYYRFTKTETDY